MLDVRLAAFRERPIPKILWIEHIWTNRDTLREADARHCQPSGAWRIGVHHDLPPFGPDASDGSSVPANAPYVLGIDLNRSESRCGAADPSCTATQTIADHGAPEDRRTAGFRPGSCPLWVIRDQHRPKRSFVHVRNGPKSRRDLGRCWPS